MAIWLDPPCDDAMFIGFFDDSGLVELPTLYCAYRANKSDLAEKTVSRYGQALYLYIKYLDRLDFSCSPYSHNDERILHATRSDINNFLRERTANGIDRATRRVDEIAIKDFYVWLTTEEGGNRLVSHPYTKKAKITTLKPPKKLKYGLTTQQFIRLLFSVHNECERVFLQYAYDIGSRSSTLCKLTKGAIDDAEKYVLDLEREKNHRPRYVPIIIPIEKKGGREIFDHHCLISLPTLERILQYHKTEEYEYSPNWDYDDPNKPAFLTVTGKQWKKANFGRLMRDAARRSGVIMPKAKLPTPHTLRHSSAYAILTSADHGVDGTERLVAAMSQLAHSTITATSIYTRLPIPLGNSEEATIYDRASRIYKETFLPPRLHNEHRGHGKRRNTKKC